MWSLARAVSRHIVCAFALVSCACVANCERLALRVYSIADGLPHIRVNRIQRDLQGFIWFCTDGGLSKWNGYEFETFTKSDGLPHAHVNDFLETRRGDYWIATDGGLARYYPDRQSTPFVTYFPGSTSLARTVNVLLEDRDSTLLVGTDDGLYRLEQSPTSVHMRPEFVGFAANERDGALVNTLLLTSDGKLWVGTGSGIYCRGVNGRWRRFSRSNGLPENFTNQLRKGPDDQIWAATRGGLVELAAEPERAVSIVTRLFTKTDGLPTNDVSDFLISTDGHVWVATTKGLAEGSLNSSHSKVNFRTRSIVEGLADQSIYWLFEDLGGDLWLATGQTGAIRLSRAGFHSYTQADGFLPQEYNQILENGGGHISIINGDRSKRLVQYFDRDRFVRRSLPHAPSLEFGFEWHQFAIQDRVSQWWFASERGALRISDLDRPPAAVQSKFVSALPMSRGVWHVFQDSHGLIWLAEEGRDSDAVVTWNPSNRTRTVLWRRFSSSAAKRTAASCFLEDKSGQIWVGLSGEGGLMRRRRDQFDCFSHEDGVPIGEITDLYQDHSGAIWVASTEGGLGRVSEITADHPHIEAYNRASGLTSDEIWCVTEDRGGRIYAGTARGIDVINPATNRVVTYSSDDGLIPGPVRSCFCDRAGEVWFVTNQGVSRFNPDHGVPHPPPRVLITQFLIRGAGSPVPRSGESHIGPVALGPAQTQVTINFIGVDNRLRGDLRYQYRLFGGPATWSKPTAERSVTLASLAPQRYRFEVRTLDRIGAVSIPAMAEFSISPPILQRWWFRLLSAILAGGALFWLHRYRTLRLLELERIRTRIAADLHDDIGAGLSQIAVLTEVASTRVSDGPPDLKGTLSSIVSVSRELSESMNDIVWSVNPQRDYLSDLIQRMRRFSSDVLGGSDIDFHFRAQVPEDSVAIAASVRREVYLIFKEAVNNLVRHSACTRAEVEISVERSSLNVQIDDNGKGLCERRNNTGTGLQSMKERAHRIGASIDFTAGEDGGLRIVFHVPMPKTFPNRLIGWYHLFRW